MSNRATKTSFGPRRSSGTQARPNKGQIVLKWVAGATAVLSLFFALHQLMQLAADVRERQRQVAEFYQVGKQQQDAGDYESAWASFEQAAKSAEAGGLLAKITGSLSEEQRKSRSAQEALAMEWAENLRGPQGKASSDTVDRLVPILARGAARATGVHKADLLAHLGWAYFLKAKNQSSILEEPVRLNIERHYREALEIDPANPYAHVFWGHLILWNGRSLDEALRHFSAAIHSGRATAYVRSIQLAALRNRGRDGDAEFLKAVIDMVKNHETVDAETRSDVYAVYYFALNRDEDFRRLTVLVPPQEQIALVRALFYDTDFEPSKVPTREASVATLQEAAGLRDEALKTWLAMRSGLSRDSIYNARAAASIKRLSGK